MEPDDHTRTNGLRHRSRRRGRTSNLRSSKDNRHNESSATGTAPTHEPTLRAPRVSATCVEPASGRHPASTRRGRYWQVRPVGGGSGNRLSSAAGGQRHRERRGWTERLLEQRALLELLLDGVRLSVGASAAVAVGGRAACLGRTVPTEEVLASER